MRMYFKPKINRAKTVTATFSHLLSTTVRLRYRYPAQRDRLTSTVVTSKTKSSQRIFSRINQALAKKMSSCFLYKLFHSIRKKTQNQNVSCKLNAQTACKSYELTKAFQDIDSVALLSKTERCRYLWQHGSLIN